MEGASSLFAGLRVSISVSSIGSSMAFARPSAHNGSDLRSGTHLSALALETASALLSPLSSHLQTVDWVSALLSRLL